LWTFLWCMHCFRALYPDQPIYGRTPTGLKRRSRRPRAHWSSSRHRGSTAAPSRRPRRTARWCPAHGSRGPRSYAWPTSLIYIIKRTRGSKPWRPDADIGTTCCSFIASLGVSRATLRTRDTTETCRCFTETTSLSSDEPFPGSPFLN